MVGSFTEYTSSLDKREVSVRVTDHSAVIPTRHNVSAKDKTKGWSDFLSLLRMKPGSVKNSNSFRSLALAGLVAKGIVYCLLGVLLFMSAFHLNGKSTTETDNRGVFSFVEELPAGRILLAVIALGLLCYMVWRVIQAFGDTERKGKDVKGLAQRGRYLLSGLFYLSIAALAVKMIFSDPANSDQKQNLASLLFAHSLGKIAAFAVALIFTGNGCYQVYYGLAEKFSKHIGANGKMGSDKLINAAAKAGYTARGITWILIGWLFGNAAWHANAAEAGDSSKAFTALSESSYGIYMLAAMGLGLICYGVFNFIRARYEGGEG